MSIQFDCTGVPVYDGTPSLFDEYRERCWDLYYGRSGQDSLQAATPIHLRAGTRGTAYDAVRDIGHKDLVTLSPSGKPLPKGMETYLEQVRRALDREAPIRATETFDKVFYAKAVWRDPHESMHSYIIRRERELNDLTKVSAKTIVSPDIQAHLLLRFSGLSITQQNQIVSSCKNEYDPAQFQMAPRMQHPNIHLHCGSPPPGTGKGATHGKSKGEGKSTSYHTGETWDAYSSYLDQDYPQHEHEEESNAADASAADATPAEESYAADAIDENDPNDIPADVNVDEMDQEEIEALAAIAQARRVFKNSKGKGKGNSSATPSASSVPFKASGEISFADQQKARQAKVQQVKLRTKCAVCGQFGHWRGDAECSRRGAPAAKSAAPAPKPGTFFTIFEQDAAVENEPMTKKGPRLAMREFCGHCYDHTSSISRGANGSHGYFNCEDCDESIISVPRRSSEHREPAGVGLWAYMITAFLYHPDNHNMRLRALRRMTTTTYSHAATTSTSSRTPPPAAGTPCQKRSVKAPPAARPVNAPPPSRSPMHPTPSPARPTPHIAPGEKVITIPTAVETPDGTQQAQVPLHVFEHFATTHGTVPLQVPPHMQQQQQQQQQYCTSRIRTTLA